MKKTQFDSNRAQHAVRGPTEKGKTIVARFAEIQDSISMLLALTEDNAEALHTKLQDRAMLLVSKR